VDDEVDVDGDEVSKTEAETAKGDINEDKTWSTSENAQITDNSLDFGMEDLPFQRYINVN
jgi:hypothetical protein